MQKTFIEHKYLIIIVLLIAGLFSWFQLRPSWAKQDCVQKASQSHKESFSRADTDPDRTGNLLNDGKIDSDVAKTLREKMDLAYKYCLHSKGL